MGFQLDVARQRFGKWKVLRFAGNIKGGCAIWLCRCDCGREQKIPLGNLRSGQSTCCRNCANRCGTHGLSKTLVYAFWLDHRSLLVARWRESVTLFNGECWSQRARLHQQLVPVDDAQPIGPGNFRWTMRPKEDALRHEAAEYLISINVPPDEAEARMARCSHQRVYQILDQRDGKDAGHLRRQDNKVKIQKLISSGHMTMVKAEKITGVSKSTIIAHCRCVTCGGRTVVKISDVEKLIVPHGWVRISEAARRMGSTSSIVYYRVKKNKLDFQRIGGGVYMQLSDVRRLRKKNRKTC